MEELFKRYVDVELCVTKDGGIKPTAIYWGEKPIQRRYMIDRIIQGPIYQISRLGSYGKKYVVLICGEKRILFREHCQNPDGRDGRRWFIESHHP